VTWKIYARKWSWPVFGSQDRDNDETPLSGIQCSSRECNWAHLGALVLAVLHHTVAAYIK
jgi:hypothetical protein